MDAGDIETHRIVETHSIGVSANPKTCITSGHWSFLPRMLSLWIGRYCCGGNAFYE